MASSSSQPRMGSESGRTTSSISGFGMFKTALTGVLTVTIILELATLFDYPPALVDKLHNAKDCGLLMVACMEERGQITPTDISPLFNALLARGLNGIAAKVQGWFREYLSGNTGKQPANRDWEPKLSPELEEKKKLLVKQLKGTYQTLYDRVQPIPYIKEKLYTVNKIFVEAGIDVMCDSLGSWTSLHSYHDICKDANGEPRIQIIEGDPGYGKSTLALQLVYDWCNNVPGSPLTDADIVFFLNLRQLGGVKSIYEAITHLLPKDTTINKGDIQDLLQCEQLSMLVVFEAYDEYPDQGEEDTDVDCVIREKMLRHVNVIITTRSSCIPPGCGPRTGRIRLTGFDDRARERYVRKAVTGDDDDLAVAKIMHQFKNNPILGDICQAPLFSVMYAHLAHEDDTLQEVRSVTQFFGHMIACFHSHMQNKTAGRRREKLHTHELKHRKLDEEAFQGLTGVKQQLVWDKKYLVRKLGREFFDSYSNIGILVEEEVLDRNYDLAVEQSIQYKTEVRFYHKLFCEWYAAQRFVRRVKSFWAWFYDYSKRIDPFDLQFVYRFACGLDASAASEIVKLVRRKKDGDKFAVLCALEQADATSDVRGIVSDIVSRDVSIAHDDSRLLQRTTVQLLQLASQNEITTPCVRLSRCIATVDGSSGTITLKSGPCLQPSQTLMKIEIDEEKRREISEEELLGLLKYAENCEKLQEVVLTGCLLPVAIPLDSIPASVSSRKIKVTYARFGFRLSLRTARWEVDDVDTVRRLCSETVNISEQDTMLLQQSTVLLLEKSSQHQISTTCLRLDRCIASTDNASGTVTLKSGLCLQPSSTLRKIEIVEEKKREISEEEMVGLLKYAENCEQLQEIVLTGCLLPLSIPRDSIPASVSSRKVKVCYARFAFRLSLQTARWEVDDVDTVRRLCSEIVNINEQDTMLLQQSKVLLLEKSSQHQIPMSCLRLDRCIAMTDNSSGTVTLQSGLCLPPSSTLRKIEIDEETKNEISEEKIVALLRYADSCEQLLEIVFNVYNLPVSVPKDSVPANLLSRSFSVSWSPKDRFQLDLHSGIWEVENENLSEKLSGVIRIQRNDSLFEQASKIMCLKIASAKNIAIARVYLNKSFQSADTSTRTITLKSGLSLPSLASVQMIDIDTEWGREMTVEETTGILTYAQQSQALQTLEFGSCLLPQTLPAGSIPETWRRKDVKVKWYPGSFGGWHIYDLGTQKWMDSNGRSVSDGEYAELVRKFRDEWSSTLWQKKRRAAGKTP